MRTGTLVTMTAVAVLATACGGSTSSTVGSAPGVSANFQQALAYSECMRSHGVPDFPDPDASGLIAIQSTGPGNSGQMQTANDACQHLQPGGAVSPAQTQRNLILDLRLSQCVRAHGVPDFPGPGANGQSGTPTTFSKSEAESPQVQAALRTCRSLLHMPAKATP
jgi:hypothetical protein